MAIASRIFSLSGADSPPKPTIRSTRSQALTLAVVASVRHEDTEYDSLLMSGVPRDEARDRIRPDIERVLDALA
jgi:hypothetical protein